LVSSFCDWVCEQAHAGVPDIAAMTFETMQYGRGVCFLAHLFFASKCLITSCSFPFLLKQSEGCSLCFSIWSYRGDEARHGVIQLAVAGSHPPQVWWQVQAYTPPPMIPISAQIFFDFHDVKVLHFIYIYVSYKNLLEWIIGCKR
jgi:hypothetical protein